MLATTSATLPRAAAPQGRGAAPAGLPRSLARPALPRAAVPKGRHCAARRRASPPPLSAVKSDEYSKAMQGKMGGSLTYDHDRGINFATVLPDIIVGSCLQTAEDVDRLAEEEGVTAILCLQEDSDMDYFNLDIGPIQRRCEERGDIRHIRTPIHDFDPFSLRMNLAESVSTLTAELEGIPGKAYIHCTAGLGRAPGVALAYMYWMRGMTLEGAYEQLFDVRPCHPKLEAIRAATADLLVEGAATCPVVLKFPFSSTFEKVEVAGLDVGWGLRIPLAFNKDSSNWEATRELPYGKYNYKFVVDRGNGEGERWVASGEALTLEDGGHANNYVSVVAPAEVVAARDRYLQVGCDLTAGERDAIAQKLLRPPSERGGRGGKSSWVPRWLKWVPFLN